MNLLSDKKLCYRLIVYLCLASIVLMAVMSVVSFRIELSNANRQAEHIASQLVDTLARNATLAVYQNNHPLAKELLNDLSRNDVIAQAELIDSSGLVFEQTKKMNIDKQKRILRPLYSPLDKKQQIGQFNIQINPDFNAMTAKNALLSHTFNTFIFVVLQLFIMLLLAHFLFIRPLNGISYMLRDIIVGDQERIDILSINKNDELGHLVVNINKILDALNTKLSTQRVLRKRIESVEKKLRDIFQSTSAGLFLLDEQGNILTCTPTLLNVLNYEDSSLIAIHGQNFAQLFFKEPERFQQMLQNAQESGQLEADDLMLCNNTEEHPLWAHCLLSKVIYKDGITRFEGVVLDISKRVAAEKATQYEANHDTLTGLLRRSAAEQQLKKQLTLDNYGSIILLLLDLDGFKMVNDTYGHDVGDSVLIETTKHFEACVRHHDIVCRLGGDEFLIVLLDCKSVDTSFKIAEEIIALLSLPMTPKENIVVNIGVSIGISLFPMHGNDVESLLKAADEAMYKVKDAGRNGYAIKGKNGVIVVNRPLAKRRDIRSAT